MLDKFVTPLARAWAAFGAAERAILAAFGVAISVGFAWGLPNSNTWAVDAISPRSCGMAAIVEAYWPGHFHTYPPFHMALLTILSLPWMAAATLRVGADLDALRGELIKPVYMTGIEVSARLLAATMALGTVANTMRWWKRLHGRLAGIGAGVVVASNSILVYYAHTGNLEVPYLFWTTWSLLELDRVLAGEPRERQALLCAAVAILSKDQSAAALLLAMPLALAIVPWVARRDVPWRRGVVSGIVRAGLVYGLVSGMVVNPVGFFRRVRFLLGPASQPWASYPPGFRGIWMLCVDAARAIPHFTSWPIALAVIPGIALATFATRGVDRARTLMPLLAAVSFTLLFTFGARRSEHRFLLPQTLFLLPYASLVAVRAWGAWPRARWWLAAGAACCVAPALIGVASVDGTLLVDSRYEVETFLARLPPASRVEIYGTALFLPRVQRALGAVRPGIEPVDERQRIFGVTELVDPDMDPTPRSPDVIVLSTALSMELVTYPPPPLDNKPYGSTTYHDVASHRLFRRLFDGSLGYDRILVARCALPWPLECRSVHNATGQDVWVYARRDRPADSSSGAGVGVGPVAVARAAAARIMTPTMK